MSTEQKSQPSKRCTQEGCKCKIKMTDFPCKCGKFYCSQHRHAEIHNCTFDYKQMSKEFLLKTMSTPVISEKVTII